MARVPKKGPYTTKQVAQLVGIDPRTVKNYADVPSYGIQPQQLGEGTGSRKLYTEKDVLRIELAEKMARIGLTPAAIGQALSKIPDKELTWATYREQVRNDAPTLVFHGKWNLIPRGEVQKLSPGENYYFALNIHQAIESIFDKWYREHDADKEEMRKAEEIVNEMTGRRK